MTYQVFMSLLDPLSQNSGAQWGSFGPEDVCRNTNISVVADAPGEKFWVSHTHRNSKSGFLDTSSLLVCTSLNKKSKFPLEMVGANKKPCLRFGKSYLLMVAPALDTPRLLNRGEPSMDIACQTHTHFSLFSYVAAQTHNNVREAYILVKKTQKLREKLPPPPKAVLFCINISPK